MGSLKNGSQPGAPKLLKASSVVNIPLSNARSAEVLNFLSAFGFPTTVKGVTRKTTVLDKAAFAGASLFEVSQLSKDARGEIGSRFWLRKTPQQVKVELKARGASKTFFYRRLVQLDYTYEAPVAPRVAKCLGEDVGGVVAIDPGGRCFTEVTMEFKGATDDGGERYAFKATEHFGELPGKILARTAKSGAKLSRAQISRNERNRDLKARQFYTKLKNKIEVAERDGSPRYKINAMRKQLAKGGFKGQPRDRC